jgi:hypothetical protein
LAKLWNETANASDMKTAADAVDWRRLSLQTHVSQLFGPGGRGLAKKQLDWRFSAKALRFKLTCCKTSGFFEVPIKSAESDTGIKKCQNWPLLTRKCHAFEKNNEMYRKKKPQNDQIKQAMQSKKLADTEDDMTSYFSEQIFRLYNGRRVELCTNVFE